MKSLKSVALIVIVIAAACAADASETGHFSPGVANIRDYFVPPTGFYGIIYNYMYMSDRVNDSNGDEIDKITIGAPPMSATLDLDMDLDVYAISPGVMWSTKWKVLGANYGAYAVLGLANTSIGASLTTLTGSGRSGEASQFNVGDLFVQPVWLGWVKPHWGVSLGYGFYAPIGKYETETLTLPVVGEITTEAVDNIGLGFWTNQFQGAAAWYPWDDKRMAVTGVLTWEVHGKKKDFDLTPGQNLTLNWGVSEYLPLTKDQKIILDVGLAGYDSWQATDDSGDDAAVDPSVRDEVHGVGAQVGAMYAPWHVFVSFRYLYEYAAKDRFMGQSLGLNFAIGF